MSGSVLSDLKWLRKASWHCSFDDAPGTTFHFWPTESGAEATRTPNASRISSVHEPHEAFGVRRVHRRFRTRGTASNLRRAPVRSKAVSPLRSATAVQDAAAFHRAPRPAVAPNVNPAFQL
jgi:hypothetical protein